MQRALKYLGIYFILTSNPTFAAPWKISVEEIATRIESDKRTVQNDLDLIDRKTDSINLALQNESNAIKKIRLIEAKINAIEARDSIAKDSASKAKKNQYQAGKVVLDAMIRNTAIISFMSDLADLSEVYGKLTSFWADSTFRNNWDTFYDLTSSWGVTIAGGTSVIGGVLDNSILQVSALGVGAIAVGLSKILAVSNGESGSTEVMKKYKFIELSRRAYDELSVRSYLLKEYIKNDSIFIDSLKAFSKFYDSSKDSSLSIFQLKSYYKEYETVLNQIPAYTNSFKSLQETYADSLPEFKGVFDILNRKIVKIDTKYKKDIKPFFEISQKDKILIGLW